MRTIAYKEVAILRITYGEYESRCDCCKSFRTQPDDVFPKAKYDNKVRDAVLEAYARQELPFDIIAARLADEDGLDPASLIQVYFVLQVAFRRSIKLRDVAVEPFGHREGQSVVMPIDRTWLRMTLKETPSGITGTCRYKNDLFTPNTVRRWIEDYRAILTNAAANPENSLGRLADRRTEIGRRAASR